MNSIDLRIENAVASVEMEGFTITEEDCSLARGCIRGEIPYDEAATMIMEERWGGWLG